MRFEKRFCGSFGVADFDKSFDVASQVEEEAGLHVARTLA